MNWSPSPAETSAALSALENSATISPLNTHGLLRFNGEDTPTFLQGQLSSDIKALDKQSAQYTSYSTAKGRMLASALIFRTEESYYLQMSADILPAVQKRLTMYILRSKTQATDASLDYTLFGIAGPQASLVAKQIAPELPTQPLGITRCGASSIIQLPGDRYQIIVPTDQAADFWKQYVAAGATPADESIWRLSDIRAGIPWITSGTQEEFVPQMANLDLIGGVNFKKGCYTGQEIIARTQHLGKIKRRMFRTRIATESAMPGQDIFSPEMNEQAVGKIVLAAPTTPGFVEALVVIQLPSLEHALHLGAPDGPRLQLLELPYEIA